MSTEPAPAGPRRVALVLAAAGAAPATPPGVDRDAFARACLADAYEVVADLVGVTSGIVGPPSLAELLWPGGLLVGESLLPAVVDQLTGDFDELVLVPADVPDLPGLVLAKLFKVLHRVDLAVAPERHGPGCAALGISLPTQVDLADLDLDLAPTARTFGGVRIASGPDWHRLRTPADVDRLDPGLEGWEETRALLSGHARRPAERRMTVGWDAGQTLAVRFRAHATDSRTLYGFAMRGMADDWEAGGPVREVCAGYENAPSGSVIQLRLLAGLFRIVLTDRAPQLRPFYPCLGGTAPPEAAWPVMRAVVGDHIEELRAGLRVAPQTNEVGRSAALLVGLFDVAAASGKHRLRLLEIGASAGLNLLVDRFAFDGPGWSFGPADAMVRLSGAIEGPVSPRPFTITQRRGCDLEPIDPTTPDGRLVLTSYVWPFHLARHQRLAAALAEAQWDPPVVDRASAADWLDEQLGGDHNDDPNKPGDQAVLTVVWHSITQLYWQPTEVVAVDSVLTAYGRRGALARIGMEYAPGSSPTDRPVVSTTLWLPGTVEPRVVRLGTAHDHGPPVRLGSAHDHGPPVRLDG